MSLNSELVLDCLVVMSNVEQFGFSDGEIIRIKCYRGLKNICSNYVGSESEREYCL